jgi:hypothetical protein
VIDPDKQISYGRYVVALHDLLAQEDDILKWSSYEQLVDENSQAFQAFKETVSTLIKVRSDFTGL